MTPREYELAVAELYRTLGYEVAIQGGSNDFGVDIFASNGVERLAIQAKMFGKGIRKINHEMILYLQGAKDYFDCDRAIIATDGALLPSAQEVANKLGIEILKFDPNSTSTDIQGSKSLFDVIWESEIMPLEGRILSAEDGRQNEILKVDWSGLRRVTSGGRRQTIKVEIFRRVVDALETNGEVTREWINQEYRGQASSGICLILSQSKRIRLERNPVRLILLPEPVAHRG